MSWIAWNYKFLLVVFSSMPVLTKLSTINQVVFPDLYAVLGRGAAFPLLTALIYIFAFPIPELYVYRYWRERQKRVKEVQQAIDDETPLTRDEARQIRKDAFLAQQDYEKELERKGVEITRLRDQIDILTKNINANSFSAGREERQELLLTEEQYMLLSKIASSEKGLPRRTALEIAGGEGYQGQHNIDVLEEANLIQGYTHDENGGFYYRSAINGRRYLVKHPVFNQTDSST